MMYLVALLGSLLMMLPSARAAGEQLPAHLQEVRRNIIDICLANTTRDDNIKDVRAQLEPLIEQLAQWYNANRPANEVALTQRPWRSIWYDDPTIDEFSNSDFGGVSIRLDRSKVYQVVEDGYYYNVSESTLRVGRAELPIVTFLKGAYTVANPAGPENQGQAKLNVVDLEFVFNAIRFNVLPNRIGLERLVRFVDARFLDVLRVPGPIGITGELWNVYIDEELRISAGREDQFPDTIDLYILLQQDRTGPIPVPAS